MDVHMHNSRTLHYGLNNGPRRSSEDDLQFLSHEERECILFFEETIGFMEEDDERTVERPAPYTHTARHHTPVDYDIIDLVHPTPNPNKHKDPSDSQERTAAPEIRQVKRDPLAALPVPDGPPEERRPPPAASAKITQKQVAPQIISLAPQPLQRRSSLEFPQNPSAKHGPPTHAKPTHLPSSIGLLLGSRDSIPQSIAAEAASVQEHRATVLSSLSGAAHPLEGGEPLCVRRLPTRSVSFRDPTPNKSRMEALSKLGLAQRRSQSVMDSSPRDSENAKTSADIIDQTRRTQYILHSSPRDSESYKICADVIDQTRRTQSIMDSSPRDSEKFKTSADIIDQTRRAQSIMNSSPRDSEKFKTSADIIDQTRRTQSIMNSSPRHSESAKTPVLKPYASVDVTDQCQTRRTQYILHSSPRHSESAKTPVFKPYHSVDFIDQTRRTQAIPHSSPRHSENLKTPLLKPYHSVDFTDQTRRTQSIPHSSPRHSQSAKTRADVTDHSQPKSSTAPNLTSAEVTHSDFNSYGGKSITVHPTLPLRTEPTSAPLPKTEAHLNNSRASPEPIHGARTKTFFPDHSSSIRTANQGLPTRKASHSEALPTPAPRPLRHTGPQSPPGPRSPEARRTSFRAQGITVQFSGRGATDEARRNALRRLGLLRDSH